MTETFPAPWSLRGQGHIFLYRFSQAFLARGGLIPTALRDAFVGGVGALMLVDYAESNCGPYRELLLIPGSFRLGGVVRPSITQIVVSSQVSVVNGQKNWGIPKQQADFIVESKAEGGESWSIRSKGEPLFRGTVSPVRWTPPLPIHSALIPHKIAQLWQDQLFVTKVSARGWGRPCKLTAEGEPSASTLDSSLARPSARFDLRDERPLLGVGISVDPFQMTFHVPTVSAQPA